MRAFGKCIRASQGSQGRAGRPRFLIEIAPKQSSIANLASERKFTGFTSSLYRDLGVKLFHILSKWSTATLQHGPFRTSFCIIWYCRRWRNCFWVFANMRMRAHLRKLFICQKSLNTNLTFLQASVSHFPVWICRSEAFWLSLQVHLNRFVQMISFSIIMEFLKISGRAFFVARRDSRNHFLTEFLWLCSKAISLNGFLRVRSEHLEMLELTQNEFPKCQFLTPCQNRCRRPAYLVASKESDCLFSPKGPPKSNWFRKRVGTWDMASQPRWSGWHFAFKVTRTTGENNWRRDKVIWSMGWRDCVMFRRLPEGLTRCQTCRYALCTTKKKSWVW